MLERLRAEAIHPGQLLACLEFYKEPAPSEHPGPLPQTFDSVNWACLRSCNASVLGNGGATGFGSPCLLLHQECCLRETPEGSSDTQRAYARATRYLRCFSYWPLTPFSRSFSLPPDRASSNSFVQGRPDAGFPSTPMMRAFLRTSTRMSFGRFLQF